MKFSNHVLDTIHQIKEDIDTLDLFQCVGGSVEHSFWLAIDAERLEKVRVELESICEAVAVEINSAHKRA